MMACVVRFVELLLYKRLPMCVFIFVCLASPHRECIYNTVLALHLDTTVLSDGTYELIPDSEEGDQEAQVNSATLTDDPDQSPEEPKAVLASDYREGKPRT